MVEHAPSAELARARFAVATDEHLTAPLPGGITIRHVESQELATVSEALWATDPRPIGRLGALFAADERARFADLEAVLAAPLAHRLVLEKDGEIIGCYTGQQEPYGRYYMVNTVVRRDAQGKGIYRALLPRIVIAAAASGFREIYSRHRADNNTVIAAKLKAGFMIAGFEVSPRFGLLVHLRRYLVAGLERAFAHRVDGAHGVEMRAAGVVVDR